MIKGIKTIAQYKIMQHINNNFFSSSITTDLIADNQIKVTDSSGDSIIFTLSPDGKVVELPVNLSRP